MTSRGDRLEVWGWMSLCGGVRGWDEAVGGEAFAVFDGGLVFDDVPTFAEVVDAAVDGHGAGGFPEGGK